MWPNWKKDLWQWRGIWITVPSVTVTVILLRFLGLLQLTEWAAYDQYMRWRPGETRDDRIVIVGINENDLREIKQPVFPDAIYAQLLTKLTAMEPRGIGLDIYRDLPVEPGHQELVEVFETNSNIVGITKVVGERDRDVIDPPPALAAKGQIGSNDLKVDPDKKVRRGFLFVTLANGDNVWSFGSYLTLLYLAKEDISLEPVPEDDTKFRLGKAVLSPFEAYDGGYVRADAGGYQMLLNYRGPSRHFETVSLMDILEDRVPPDWGRDRIVLIGTVSEGFKDLFNSPYSSSVVRVLEPMAGIEIHANLISQLISAAMDDRPLFKVWPEPLEWLWILFWSGVGATIVWVWRDSNSIKAVSLKKIGALAVSVGLLVGSTYLAFVNAWWIPIIPPMLGLAGSAIAVTAYVARSAGDIRKTFGRYLSDEIVSTLLENPEGLKMGGERRSITIFTSDLRGFTATSERLPPEEVVKILNFYLEYMADVITKYQGTIDEFMGDGILVLFGAPIRREDDAKRAIACGVAMQQAMITVNKQMKEWNLPPLDMGIGINTGEVVVGNIGSEKRTKYGIVGSQVNLTYRIESYTTGGQILISEETLKEAGDIVKIDGQKTVQPKGVKEPITIYSVSGIEGEYNLHLTKEEEVFVDLVEPLSIQYVSLAGKHVGDEKSKGTILKLSAKEAEVRCEDSEPVVPEALTNVKLNFVWNGEGETSEDVYAKVTEKQGENGSFYIHFTAQPPDVSAKLTSLYESLAK
jgi:adenylate cyclase